MEKKENLHTTESWLTQGKIGGNLILRKGQYHMLLWKCYPGTKKKFGKQSRHLDTRFDSLG